VHNHSAHQTSKQIDLRVQDIGQLWHTLDPLPFRERDLDSAVEEFLVSWVSEIAAKGAVGIVVRLPKAEAEREEAGHVGDAIRNYFHYRSEVVGHELRELFRVGRASLAVGVAVLAACTVVAQIAARGLEPPLGRFFEEGLIILGWVANWHPLQIFLYGWQPLLRRRRLYQRLADAEVTLSPF